MFKVSESDKARLQQLANSTDRATNDLMRRLLMNYDMMEMKLRLIKKEGGNVK